jgi:hypothetical protein
LGENRFRSQAKQFPLTRYQFARDFQHDFVAASQSPRGAPSFQQHGKEQRNRDCRREGGGTSGQEVEIPGRQRHRGTMKPCERRNPVSPRAISLSFRLVDRHQRIAELSRAVIQRPGLPRTPPLGRASSPCGSALHQRGLEPANVYLWLEAHVSGPSGHRGSTLPMSATGPKQTAMSALGH